LGLPELPILFVVVDGVSSKLKYLKELRADMLSLKDKLDHLILVVCILPSTLNSFVFFMQDCSDLQLQADGVHLEAQSQVELGGRLARAYVQWLGLDTSHWRRLYDDDHLL